MTIAGCATSVDWRSPSTGRSGRADKDPFTELNRLRQAAPSSVAADPWPGKTNPIRGCNRQPEEDAALRIEQSTTCALVSAALVEPGPERFQTRRQLRRPCGDDRRSGCPVLECPGKLAGQVGELGPREPTSDGQELVDLAREVIDVATSQKDQLGVLGRGEQGPLARVERSRAAGR